MDRPGRFAAEAPAGRDRERVDPAGRGRGTHPGPQQRRRRVHLVRNPFRHQAVRLPLHQPRVQVPCHHGLVGQQAAQEARVRRDAEGDRVRQGRAQLAQGRRAVGPVRDDLGQHRVVQAADLRALGEARVGARSVALRLVQGQDRAARRQEAPRRVLGADTGLDRVAREADVLLGEGQLLARRHPQLPLHQVQAAPRNRHDQLRHRVLDLEAGVHLHEVVRGRVAARDDELHRARADIAARAGRLHGGGTHRGPGLVVQQDARRLLDDLLVAPLQRALALTEMDHMAMAVRQDLDLDVPGAVDPPLHQQRVIAEGGAGLAPGGGDLLQQRRLDPGEPHALAAAARRGLQQHRHADLACRVGELIVGQAGSGRARHHRDARRLHRLLRADLVAHQRDRRGRRPDEGQARLRAGPRERRVLGEEAVARVDRLRASTRRRFQQTVDGEVALGGGRGADTDRRVRLPYMPGVRVRVAEHGHRAHAQRPQRTDDADRDLAAVGDQDSAEHLGPHIRKTPKPGSPSGALAHAVRARPSTCRVSSGSITPSSHSRAVA